MKWKAPTHRQGGKAEGWGRPVTRARSDYAEASLNALPGEVGTTRRKLVTIERKTSWPVRLVWSMDQGARADGAFVGWQNSPHRVHSSSYVGGPPEVSSTNDQSPSGITSRSDVAGTHTGRPRSKSSSTARPPVAKRSVRVLLTVRQSPLTLTRSPGPTRTARQRRSSAMVETALKLRPGMERQFSPHRLAAPAPVPPAPSVRQHFHEFEPPPVRRARLRQPLLRPFGRRVTHLDAEPPGTRDETRLDSNARSITGVSYRIGQQLREDEHGRLLQLRQAPTGQRLTQFRAGHPDAARMPRPPHRYCAAALILTRSHNAPPRRGSARRRRHAQPATAATTRADVPAAASA